MLIDHLGFNFWELFYLLMYWLDWLGALFLEIILIFYSLFPLSGTLFKAFFLLYILSLSSISCFSQCSEAFCFCIITFVNFSYQFINLWGTFATVHAYPYVLKHFLLCFPFAFSEFRDYIKVFDTKASPNCLSSCLQMNASFNPHLRISHL